MAAVDRVGGVLVETYRLERLIAEGSMGSVYEARHLRIPKRFAVKFLRIGLEENREALERFRREAEVVAGLDHPNIVEIYDYNVADDGSPYIVLEYLDGEHLAARLRAGGGVAVAEALPIVAAVASALSMAHAREVIHRDLKPENIVLCADGGVKVVDFGVAKLRGAPELTAVNTIVGTVPYMAPEQLMGGVLDARVDQYALAAIAYEMLAGHMAFDGSGSVADVARRVLTHVPPFIAGVPQAVNEVIFRGMARARDDRFASVAEFGAALADAAAVKEPSLPEGAHADVDELPPLAGEATRITVGDGGHDGGAHDDAEDQPAPPPADAAPSKEPRTPTIPSPLPVLGGVTDEMTAVRPDDATGERAALPSLSTLVVEKLSDGSTPPSSPMAPPLSEPKITLKTMKAATAPIDWDAAAKDATKSIYTPPRWLWILVGAVGGIALALFVVLLMRH
jgi:serine/threonine-protein kinase